MNIEETAISNLIIVCGTLEAGGAERVISVLSAYFLNYFKNVEIITWRKATLFYKIDKRIRVTAVSEISEKRVLISDMKVFRDYIKKRKPDLVLSFLAPFNVLTIISLIGLKVPLVVAERNDPRYVMRCYWRRKVRDWCYCLADGILVQTQTNQNYFSKFIQQKSEVIYNPVFLANEMIGMALRTEKRKKIVSVSRLKKQKNQHLLIEAFAILAQKYPNYELIIYGEGDRRPVLENQIQGLGLQEYVKLPGNKVDILDAISDAELFVLSSDYEGMPNALIEAMCLGLPCISTRVSGAVDLIENEVNGILVDIGDKDGLVKAMVQMIENKPLAFSIAEQGTRLAKELDVEIIAKQWINFLMKVKNKQYMDNENIGMSNS